MTPEMIAKAKECKSAEELLALAKENNIEMSAEEAAEKYALLHNDGELSDDELDSAAGGGCGNSPELEVGIIVRWSSKKAKHKDGCSCPTLFEVRDIHRYDSRYGSTVGVDVCCTECNAYSYGIKKSELYNI